MCDCKPDSCVTLLGCGGGYLFVPTSRSSSENNYGFGGHVVVLFLRPHSKLHVLPRNTSCDIPTSKLVGCGFVCTDS